ncbi:hypothetical protein LWE61_06370 [Sphingobium sufflavum]|uniref:hypothetical protein n=1 Tax=Sphingobium sufflavum TaxID=1129547 RepID=UPI001F29EB15|nr:hypothetical protein [Sphingobium sufflavum]MCE7796186.1 hypothetical protein [Sphingobium sufflavum]
MMALLRPDLSPALRGLWGSIARRIGRDEQGPMTGAQGMMERAWPCATIFTEVERLQHG